MRTGGLSLPEQRQLDALLVPERGRGANFTVLVLRDGSPADALGLRLGDRVSSELKAEELAAALRDQTGVAVLGETVDGVRALSLRSISEQANEIGGGP